MKKLFLLFTSCLFITTNSPGAFAKQVTQDKDWLKIEEQVQIRKVNHEKRVHVLSKQRDAIYKDIKRKDKKLSQLRNDDQSPAARQRRRNLQAEVNKLAARHLKKSFEILESAEAVMSANLKDFAKLTDRLRNSPSSRSSVRKIKREMQRTIKAGRMVKTNLVRMRSWINGDPAMKAKFKDLNQIMRNMDQKIAMIRLSFPKSTTGRGDLTSKRLNALDKATNTLINRMAGLLNERQRLGFMQAQLAHTVDLITLRITVDTASEAVPNINLSSGSDEPAYEVQSIVDELNKDIMRDTNLTDELPASNGGTGPEYQTNLNIFETKNF